MNKNETILKLKTVAETLVNLNLFQKKLDEFKDKIQIRDIDELLPEFVLDEHLSFVEFKFPKLDINKKKLRKTGYIDEFDYFIYLHTISSILVSKKEESLAYLFDNGFKQQQYVWIQIHLLRALLDIGKNGICTKIILAKIILEIDSFDSLVKNAVLDKLSHYPKTEVIDNLFNAEIKKYFKVFLKKKQAWLWVDVHSTFHRINKYDSSQLEKYFVIMEDMCLGRFDNELEEFQNPEEDGNEFEIFIYNLCKAIIGLMYFKINQSNLEINEMLKTYIKKGNDKETRKMIKKELKKHKIN